MKIRRIVALLVCSSVMCSFAACSSKKTSDSKKAKDTDINSDAGGDIDDDLDSSSATSEQVTTQSIPAPYMEILDTVRDIMTDEKLPDRYNELPYEMRGIVDTCIHQDAAFCNSHIGYSIIDIDGDGVDELIIGCIADSNIATPESAIGRAGYQILDVYTLDGDSAVNVITGWDRNSWFITSDRQIANWGSSGAAYANLDIYEFVDGGMNMNCIYSYYSDYNYDAESVDFYEVDAEGNVYQKCTDDEGWDYFADQVDYYLDDFMPIVLVPVNSL